MSFVVKNRWKTTYLLSLAALFGLSLLLTSRSDGFAEPAAAATLPDQEPACPGEPMGVQATGEYVNEPVPEVPINGEPWGGAHWAPGHRSYWHCHSGGQILMVWEGVGRVQRRGERVQTLTRGSSMIAESGEEHWHGAAPNTDAQYLQVSLPGTTYWMEEAADPDYLGNDIGINSRNEFLRTGVREQSR